MLNYIYWLFFTRLSPHCEEIIKETNRVVLVCPDTMEPSQLTSTVTNSTLSQDTNPAQPENTWNLSL